jgi:hypothetical protein
MGEKNKGLFWFHPMGPSECLEPMHALFKHIPLCVQVPMCDIVEPMEVENYPKPFPKIFEKLKPSL